ncbi:hypothetical protein L1887_48239 [Cichorium endivia]|nr:hypothetical protein L1887_48239 [Cichorium endivia]
MAARAVTPVAAIEAPSCQVAGANWSEIQYEIQSTARQVSKSPGAAAPHRESTWLVSSWLCVALMQISAAGAWQSIAGTGSGRHASVGHFGAIRTLAGSESGARQVYP